MLYQVFKLATISRRSSWFLGLSPTSHPWERTRWCQINWQIITTKNTATIKSWFGTCQFYPIYGQEWSWHPTQTLRHFVSYWLVKTTVCCGLKLWQAREVHEVKFIGSYEDETACKNFIFMNFWIFAWRGCKEKTPLNTLYCYFMWWIDDCSITQHVVLYVIYTDPETFKPTMKFLEVVAPSNSQNVPGLNQAISAMFRKNILALVLNKIFLASDGASVNCGNNSRLIRLLQEVLPWIFFIWCFSHRVKLTLKDALNNFIETNETTPRHLYYL